MKKPTSGAVARLLVTVLVMGVLVITAVQVRTWFGNQEQVSERRAVTRTAEKVATGITSLSGGQAKATSRGFSHLLTADLRNVLLGKDGQLTALLNTAKVASRGTVVASGIVDLDDKAGRVLVAVDAKVVNQEAPKGETRRYRMGITLRREGGTWLASAVELVP